MKNNLTIIKNLTVPKVYNTYYCFIIFMRWVGRKELVPEYTFLGMLLYIFLCSLITMMKLLPINHKFGGIYPIIFYIKCKNTNGIIGLQVFSAESQTLRNKVILRRKRLCYVSIIVFYYCETWGTQAQLYSPSSISSATIYDRAKWNK